MKNDEKKPFIREFSEIVLTVLLVVVSFFLGYAVGKKLDSPQTAHADWVQEVGTADGGYLAVQPQEIMLFDGAGDIYSSVFISQRYVYNEATSSYTLVSGGYMEIDGASVSSLDGGFTYFNNVLVFLDFPYHSSLDLSAIPVVGIGEFSAGSFSVSTLPLPSPGWKISLPVGFTYTADLYVFPYSDPDFVSPPSYSFYLSFVDVNEYVGSPFDESAVYSEGYSAGYAAGDSAGYRRGVNTSLEDVTPWDVFVQQVDRFLDIPILGSFFTFGRVISIGVGILFFKLILNLFLGG